MLVDDAGNLWVKRYPRLASGVRWWLVFDPDGEFICQATLPDDFVPSEFGTGYVLGLNRDEMGLNVFFNTLLTLRSGERCYLISTLKCNNERHHS